MQKLQELYKIIANQSDKVNLYYFILNASENPQGS